MPGAGDIFFELKTLDNLLKKHADAHMRYVEGPGVEPMTRMHHWIIGYLYNHSGEDIYQKDVETEFKISRSTTSNMLSLMEKKGLVIRTNAEDDARLKRLELTDRAREIHIKLVDYFKVFDQFIEDSITAEEKTEYLRITDKLRSAIEKSMTEMSLRAASEAELGAKKD